MASARLQREKTKSEPVPDRARLMPAPCGTVSPRPLSLYDAHAPALRLGQGFGSSRALAPNGLQAKLTINEAGDQFEQEADRVAEQVMRMPDPAIRLQRKGGCGGSASASESCADCSGQRVQLQRRATPVNSLAAATAPPVVHDVLRSPGQPLDHSTRAFMESRFGQDFSQVRVHSNARAAESTRAVNALAYTIGRDVVFGTGQYAPGTQTGRKLLAHELTHTLQQQQGGLQLQRTGAGNCALPAEAVDEPRDALSFAGRMAHSQIQGFFSAALSPEVPIPRATKDQRATSCPPPATPLGRADLWKFGGGFSHVEVGEIKSANGVQHASRDVDHYRLRLREMASRLTGGALCPGPANPADRSFDTVWLGGSARRNLSFDPLASEVPTIPTDLGPFWGDPLYKDLRCERRAGGAVIYWCVQRNLEEDERERERVRIGIPVGERVRRTAPQTGTRAPTMIHIDPDFREAWRQLPRQVPAGRFFNLIAPDAMYESVVGSRQMQQTARIMRIDVRNHPIFQFRTIAWSTLAIALAPVAVAAITAAVVVALPVAAPAAGVIGGGGAVAGGTTAVTGGVVIPLFSAAAAEEVAKAAAVLIVVGSLTANPSEARAADAVQAAMSDPHVIGVIDVTDDPHAGAGGFGPGRRVTADGRPYRVVGGFHSF